MKLVITAAGRGERLKPYTEIIPKLLLYCHGKTILETILEKYNIYPVEIIARHRKEIIESYVKARNISATIHEEEDERGTAGGIALVEPDEMIYSNCDVWVDIDINDFIGKCRKDSAVLGVIGFQKTIVLPYGILEFDDDGELETMHEKPSIKIWCNAGIYYISKEIAKTIKGRKNMDEVIFEAITTGTKITVYPIDEESFHDIGNFEAIRKELGYEIL